MLSAVSAPHSRARPTGAANGAASRSSKRGGVALPSRDFAAGRGQAALTAGQLLPHLWAALPILNLPLPSKRAPAPAQPPARKLDELQTMALRLEPALSSFASDVASLRRGNWLQAPMQVECISFLFFLFSFLPFFYPQLISCPSIL